MEKQTGRIEAFSDGVFGVAITLLALEIGVEVKDMQEGISNKTLFNELLALWPKYLSYFNSFASVLLMWMVHHKIFKLISTSAGKIILANGLLLLLIALVPFPTKTMGTFFNTEARTAAVVFYTAYAIVVALGFQLLAYVILCKKEYLQPEAIPALKQIIKWQWGGVAGYSAITAIAFFAPVAAAILSLCMWIFWAIMSRD